MNAVSFSRRMLLSAATAALARVPGRMSAQGLSAAEDRAIQISRHESRRQFSRLYDLMHPDAKAIIPREVVIGWYRDFLPGVDALTDANDISGNGVIAGQVEPYGDPRARVAALISGA